MTYRAPIRESGWKATVGSVFRRRHREVPAVQDVSFTLGPGEVVGFIGPNGAGKTTTMKILSGLLHATSGQVRVLGHYPWQRRADFLRRIAFIRGSQPVGGSQELTVLDTLRYQRLLYEVPAAEYAHNLEELTDLLELEDLLHRQLRALSLGERMRAGLALSLLYRPEVMFLDEPTLGLDVTGATAIRRFVAEYARQTGATVLLTSHYMADVASLCPRLVLIDEGKLRYDGKLDELAARLSPYKLIRLTAPNVDPERLRAAGELVESSNGTCVLRVPREEVARTTARLLTELDVADLAVEEAPLEVVIDRAYREGVR
ncbi:ABC transporter ATP-binding protein [Actinopolymorpha rutila]|uniref:ABC-2 type transport system ATP-binding protein n=1 Tax=Actinopolymorpha rutila TaxID=446787 RepID=A0A852Z870_9ACTN|nr:ATP-binding cassette domain-containing protein [Actinopolymorpha rutila]NYH89144.1 ABC-2 type transport system ATP-binding protein [Actinopolymorpha rutila]